MLNFFQILRQFVDSYGVSELAFGVSPVAQFKLFMSDGFDWRSSTCKGNIHDRQRFLSTALGPSRLHPLPIT